MQDGKIAIFEAEKSMRDIYQMYFERKGHQVVFTSDSADAAEAELEKFKLSGGEIDVALIDLYAGPRMPQDQKTELAVQAVGKVFQHAKIVTVNSVEQPPDGVDLAIDKMDIKGFVGYVDNLERPEF
jgi:DNA-binding NtrC family response regulator